MRASPGCPLRTLRAAMEAGAGCRRRGSGALTPLVLVLPLLAALSGAASQGTDGSGAVFAINGRGFNETEALRVLGTLAAVLAPGLPRLA